jgi:hypothetical protein
MGGVNSRAANTGATVAIELHNTNTIFQSISILFFLALAIAFGVVVKRVSEWIVDQILGKKPSSQ